MERLTIIRPDDWHVHLRDGPLLGRAAADTARCFARALVMPNLHPPVTTAAQALAYRQRILAALPDAVDFEPLMTLYLTEATEPSEIEKGQQAGVRAVKLYPAGATTGSEAGVRSLRAVYPVLEAMQSRGMPLAVHGEVADREVDAFDRERIFVERDLAGIVERFPALRVVLEHVSTREGVEFVRGAGAHVAATVTAHHLLLNRNALLAGGLNPHHYCLPVLKREAHRRAVVEAATRGHPRFFLGTDSAPHPRHAKERARGCAGIYTAHAAIELYAEAFEAAGRLEHLEAFASRHGADFYGVPRNRGRITLERRPWTVPEALAAGEGGEVVPLRGGETVAWRALGP